jgi:taurine dioxygenase
MTVEIRPLAGALGAEVFGARIAKGVSESEFADINAAFLEHLFLLFREQDPLSPEQHTAFAARFGEVDYEPFAYPLKPPGVPGHPQIPVNLKEARDRSINVGGLWHSDVTFRERPHKAGIIYAKEAPPFYRRHNVCQSISRIRKPLGRHANAARRAIGGALQRDGSWERGRAHCGELARTCAPRGGSRGSRSLNEAAERACETSVHPAVRTHPETGRKCLYLNRGFVTRFATMSMEESKPILEYLWAHAILPEFTCRLRWLPNDVGIWDNRCTLHFALNDYYGYRREFHRISVHEETRPI